MILVLPILFVIDRQGSMTKRVGGFKILPGFVKDKPSSTYSK